MIGTGATGVQTITEVAKTAGHLTVFQRTPQWCAPLHNAKIGEEEMRRIRASYPEIFARCQETSGCFIHAADPRATLEVTPEEREAFWEKLYGEPGFGIWMGNFRDILVDREANALISDFVARKIRQRVKDPAVAEKLIPKNHGFGTRRVPLESGYFEVYNQPNVKLVDLNETPIERITPTGIKTSDAEYEFDIIIYATGFDAITGAFDRIDIRGRRRGVAEGQVAGRAADLSRHPGRRLSQHADGDGPACRARQLPARRRIQRRLGDRADPLRARPRPDPHRGHRRRVATAWTDHVMATSEGLLFTEVDSWMTGINRNVEGKQVRRIMRYSGGHPAFRERCDAVAAEGYRDTGAGLGRRGGPCWRHAGEGMSRRVRPSKGRSALWTSA